MAVHGRHVLPRQRHPIQKEQMGGSVQRHRNEHVQQPEHHVRGGKRRPNERLLSRTQQLQVLFSKYPRRDSVRARHQIDAGQHVGTETSQNGQRIDGSEQQQTGKQHRRKSNVQESRTDIRRIRHRDALEQTDQGQEQNHDENYVDTDRTIRLKKKKRKKTEERYQRFRFLYIIPEEYSYIEFVFKLL